MSKPSSKAPTAPKKTDPEPSRLDDRIYELSIKTAKSVQRYRITILTLVCLVVALIVSVWAFRQYTVAQKAEVSTKLAALFEPDAEGNPPAPPNVLAEIQPLVDLAHSRGVGRRVAKESVDFLLSAVRTEFAEAATGDGADDGDVDLGADPTPAVDVPALLTKVEAIVQATKSRYPDDPDVVRWAEESLRAVRSYRDRKAPEEAREQSPVLPPKSDS